MMILQPWGGSILLSWGWLNSNGIEDAEVQKRIIGENKAYFALPFMEFWILKDQVPKVSSSLKEN